MEDIKLNQLHRTLAHDVYWWNKLGEVIGYFNQLQILMQKAKIYGGMNHTTIPADYRFFERLREQIGHTLLYNVTDDQGVVHTFTYEDAHRVAYQFRKSGGSLPICRDPKKYLMLGDKSFKTIQLGRMTGKPFFENTRENQKTQLKIQEYLMGKAAVLKRIALIQEVRDGLAAEEYELTKSLTIGHAPKPPVAPPSHHVPTITMDELMATIDPLQF